MTRITSFAAMLLAAVALSACGGPDRQAESDCLTVARTLTGDPDLKVQGINDQGFRGSLAIFIRFDRREDGGRLVEEVLRCDFREESGALRLTGLKLNAQALSEAEVSAAAATLAAGVKR